jgi:23S rRNA (uracil1939-C5)-methyltransferase
MAAESPKSEASSVRVACVHAAECAGCPLIESTYEEQLAHKHARVASSFVHFASQVSIDDVAPADPIVGYRSRAKLIVSGEKIGLFAHGGGHRVVDIPECRVLAPSLARVAQTLRRFLKHPDAAALRAIDLREVKTDREARVLATLVVDRGVAPPIERLRSFAEELRNAEPTLAGVAVNFRDDDAPQILGDETTVLGGVSQAPDTHGRSTHLATFGAFVQAHRGQAARVHDAVARAFGIDRKIPHRILDLYGGAGAIALSLAAKGADVELIESFPPAVDRARQAAKNQHVNLHATASDVARGLRDLTAKNRHFDAVVTNPPRRGMSPEARQRLAQLAPKTIAYVSCDPDTLARDLDHLSRLGFAIERLEPIDMIPLTEEIETVATLRAADPPAPKILFEDADIVVVAKEAHEEMRSLEARVRKWKSAEQAIPISVLDRSTSGAVLFVRRADLVDAWSDAMHGENALVAFVVGCRGITREKGVISRGNKKYARQITTRYRRLAIVGGHSLVRVIATHGSSGDPPDLLVAKHLAEVGHPLVGDARSGDARTNRFFEEKHTLDRPFIHALRVELDRPDDQSRLIVEAPLAGDLRIVLNRLTTKEILAKLEEKNALGGNAKVLPEA